MKAISLVLTAAVAMAALPAFAQKATPKKAPAPATATAPAAKIEADHVTGMVKKPGVKDGKFQIGSGVKKTRGTWTITVGSATIADKKGTAIEADKLTSGSNVSIYGTIDAKAKTIAAEKVVVNYLRGSKTTKVAKAPKAPKAAKADKASTAKDAPKADNTKKAGN